MRQKIKRELRDLYPAPPPLEKEAFLRKLPQPELSFPAFLLYQAGYIRKGNWLAAAGLLFLAVLAGQYMDERILWLLSACTPYLALTVAAEGSRSVRFQMEELELSSRFSLKIIVTARMGILGLGNLLLLGAVIPLALIRQGGHLWLSSFYMLIPYLLTAFCDLAIVRRYRERGGIYLCAGITACISVLCLFLGESHLLSLEMFKSAGCLLLAAVLAVLTGHEYLQILKQSEEYGWN